MTGETSPASTRRAVALPDAETPSYWPVRISCDHLVGGAGDLDVDLAAGLPSRSRLRPLGSRRSRPRRPGSARPRPCRRFWSMSVLRLPSSTTSPTAGREQHERDQAGGDHPGHPRRATVRVCPLTAGASLRVCSVTATACSGRHPTVYLPPALLERLRGGRLEVLTDDLKLPAGVELDQVAGHHARVGDVADHAALGLQPVERSSLRVEQPDLLGPDREARAVALEHVGDADEAGDELRSPGCS